MADQIFEIHDPEIDVKEIMRRIQENIRRRKAAEEAKPDSSHVYSATTARVECCEL